LHERGDKEAVFVEMVEREFEKKVAETERNVERNIHVHLIKPISMRYTFFSTALGQKTPRPLLIF